MDYKDILDLQNLPQHIAFIMDGNGRWAKKQGQHRLFGHAAGVESVKEVIKTAREIGVPYLTMYAFSTENWSRPSEEVEGLMNLLVEAITNEVDEMHENGVRLLTIGNIKGLPGNCYDSLMAAMERTKENKNLTLVLALNYSARQEILEAAKKLNQLAQTNGLDLAEFQEQDFAQLLQTKDIPDPELLIRTSGECRISNFLLWQLSYTELYFTETHWPDFRREALIKAIRAYQKRERRFGMVSEQLNKTE
ncbi:MAG: isoprenyl transferase [Flavobacteriales bacterium]